MKNKKCIIIIALAILFLAIGFAYFQATLNIRGNTSIVGNA